MHYVGFKKIRTTLNQENSLDFALGLKGNIFYELLFSDIPEIQSVAKQVMDSSKLFVGAAFVLSAIWEFFTENRYQELIVRTLLCLIIFATYEAFLLGSIKASFLISEKILKQNSKVDYLSKGFKEARRIARKELGEKETKRLKEKKGSIGWWERLLIMSKVNWNDGISVVIWLLVYIVFVILKILYTTSFYLLYVFLSLQSLFFIFPPTSGSLKGALRTYLTLIITPLVITVILIVFDSTLNHAPSPSEYTFSNSLKGLIQLLISGILLMFAPSFAAALLDGRGSTMVGNKVAQVTTAAIMATGLRSLVSWMLSAPQKAVGRTLRAASAPLWKGVSGLFRTKSQEGRYLQSQPLSEKRKKQSSPQKQEGQSLFKGRATQNEKKLAQNAKRLIKLSQKKNLNLKDFSHEEKAKAIEMARSNPRDNFIRKNIYYNILSELSSLPRSEQKSEKRKNKKRQIRSPIHEKPQKNVRADKRN